MITVIGPDESLAFLRLARKKEYHCYKTKNNVRYRFFEYYIYISKTWKEVDKNLRIKCV